MSGIIGISASWGGPRENSGGAREGAGRPRKQRAIQTFPIGPRWYVLEINGRATDRIARDLAEGESRPGYISRPSYEACFPLIAVERVKRGKRVTLNEPMFRSYAFVKFDRLVDDWLPMQSIDGVKRLVSTRSMIPIPLPVNTVEALIDGTAERLRISDDRLATVVAGTDMRVINGPFTSSMASCLEDDGLTSRISVYIFGRSTEITIPRSWLELV